jgi:ABC-type molybdate transport system ATPase subunit
VAVVGGETARLVMALMLFGPPDLLMLDEPANHSNIATKVMLIRALAQYEGAMLFVSHNRRFLAALSNRVLELTPEGILWYVGEYTEYVARTGHEASGGACLRGSGALLRLGPQRADESGGCLLVVQFKQYFLNFLPLPQGQGSLRPIL